MSDFLNNIRNLLFPNRREMSARRRPRLIAGFLTTPWHPFSTRRQRHGQCPSFEQLEVRTLLTDVSPLIDIETTPHSGSPTDGVDVNGVVYFSAESHGYGRELWKTDGTTAGTSMVADISIHGSSNPSRVTNVNGTLYFTASDGANGAELWKTDGTAAGTKMVKDIASGTLGSAPGYMFAMGGVLVFVATGSEGSELWKSDGTATGTVLLKDVRPGVQGSGINNVVLVGNTLYFSADDGNFGNELWRSDGTTAGTYRISDIAPGSLSSSPSAVTSLGSDLIFSASDGSIGRELWKSTGVAGNASLVKDIQPGSVSSFPDRFGVFNGFIYFNAQESINGSELWRTDGTSGGTALVKDLRAGTNGSGPTFLANLGSKFLFSASTSLGTELFESDGTPTGTTLLMDIFPGTSSSTPASLGKVGSTLYFRANNSSGIELWKTDGTATGTVIVKNISAVGNSNPSNALVVGNSLLFSASDDTSGNELWKSDGTAAGTVLVNDIYSGTLGSGAGNALAAVGGKIFFAANTASTGSELWVTTGSAATTSMVIDILPGSQSGFGSSFTTSTHPIVGMNGQAYFAAKSGTMLGVELWKSDGTAAGTVMVKDINPLGDSSPADLINVNGTLFFTAENSSGGIDLWKSDGTASGTVLLRNLSSSRFPTRFSAPRAVGNTLYFVGYDITTGNELWKSDGTVLGTTIVTDINPGTGSSSPGNFVEHNGQVYFTAFSGTSTQIWKTNGSAAGTVIASNIGANSLFVSDGLFYMSGYGAVNDATSSELWKWDGTSNSPVFVKDIAPGLTGSSPSDFHQMNGYVVFQAQNDATGRELWRTDGTLAGTVMVKDIAAGTEGASISNMVGINGQLYFRVSNIVTGSALMRSDGTAIGTTAITTRNVNNLTAVGSSLYFNGSSQEFGSELYRYEAISLVPTNIMLSNSTIAENSATGGTVGSLIASGSDTSATTFALVPNALDNAKFSLAGTELRTAEVFNYEAVSHYVVRVTATSAGVTITRDLSVFIGAVNEFDPQLTSPLALSVAENTLTAATFAATDLDLPTPSFTYSLVGGADAAQFTVSGNRLSFAASPNFEAPTDADANNQYIVQIAVSDGSRSQTNTLTISVTDVNEAPTNITLTNLTFAESLPAGSVVGTLGATDADGSLPITFAFVSSANDNADFEIAGNQLRTRREFDYETLADRDLSIQLVARDGLNAASALRTLNLSVTDAPERPIANDLTLSTNRNVALPLTLGGDVTNPTFTITQLPSKGILSGTAPNLTYTPNTNVVGEDNFFYTISSGGQTSYESRVSISVLSVLPTAAFQTAQIGLDEAVVEGVLRVRVNLNAPVLTDTLINVALTPGGTATIDQDFSAPASVLVPAGESTGVALINIINDEIDEADEVFTLKIEAGPDYLVGLQSTYQVTISDNDAPPDISLEKTSLTLDEANTSTTVRLRLSAIATQDILVPWTLTTQAATLGTDFTLGGGSVFSGGGNYLRIPAGANSAFLTIYLTDDTSLEPTESLKLQFNAPAYGTLKAPSDSAYTLSIRDNDERIISLQRSLVTVGEATGTYTLTAVASPPLTEPTTVPVWFGGSAVSTSVGRDYSVGSPGAFVFGANQSTASLSLTIVDDSTAEREEGIMVALLDESTSYKLGLIASTFITISDNDTSLLSFTTASSTPWENAGNQTVSISLTKALSESITIPLVLTTGTGFATKNTDFRFNTKSLTIPAGQTSASATLEILNDGANEADETIRIAFGTLPTNALVSVGTNSSSTIVIRDDDPLLSIQAVSSSVPENGTAEFDLVLSAPTWNFVTAFVSLGGTATFNVDYTRAFSDSFINSSGASPHLNYPFLATIPPSITSLRLRLPIVNDSQAEKTETITAAFTVSGGALQAPTNAATVSINDDDQNAVAFSTASGSISEAKSGTLFRRTNRRHTVAVEMAQTATRDINVGIAFGGTAKFGVDYKVLDLDAKSGLIIRKGNKTATFRLEIIADSVFEGDETIKAAIVAVSAPGTLVNPASTREFKILDDDKPRGDSGGFGLWGGEDDLQSLAEMRAAIVQSNQPLVLAGTVAITTSPSVGLIPFETTSKGKSSGAAVLDINGTTAVLPGTILLATGSKGPVDGALAFFDANFNGVLDFVDSNANGVQDDDELSELPATTAADGSFTFVLDGFDTDNNGVDVSEGRLVLSGGTDLSTGLIGLIPLTAPLGLFNITPLSTIAESLVRLNQWTVSEAMQRTTQAFGISNYNLAEGVSLYQVLGNDGLAAQAYSTHVQIYSVVVGLAEFLAGVSGRDVALLGSLIFDEMASFISTEGSTIDLTSSEVLRSIAQSVIEKQAIAPVTVENSNAVTSAIVNGILELQKVQQASDGADAGEAFLSSIYKAKKVVQGILPSDLHLLGSGSQTAAFINDKYTATGIAGLVATQTATVIVPPVVGIDSLAIVEGDSGLRNLVFTATLIGKHSYPVSVDYATADATATATTDSLGDYRAQNGTLTWAANNNDLQYISIPIEGDTAFEADEFFRILLGNPSGLVIRQAEGRGFISNNELLTLTTLAPATQAANEVRVSLSSSQAQINENGQEILNGPFLMPVQAEFSGQMNFPDQWTVDFSKNHFRADTWTFDGKVGASDELTVAAGSFNEIEYSILSSSNSSIKLRDESLVGQISLNAINVESARLLFSDADLLIVRVPDFISALLIEDADTNDTGRMRIRSMDGSFAPIEFTNPGILQIRVATATTEVALGSIDPAFAPSRIQIITNGAPADISLSQSLVAENSETNTLVGTLSSLDPDTGDTHTYTLVTGAGDANNDRFAIVNGQLRTTTMFDFETKSSYSIRIRSTDAGELSFEKQFTIGVIDVNEAPTAVSLQNVVSTLPENTSTASRIRVADIVITDDAPGTNTLSLTGADAAAFEIIGNQLFLKSGTTLDFEAKPTRSVTIQVDDPTVGSTPDLTAVYSLTLTNLTEFGGLNVQLGQTQRSYLRYLDVVFDRPDDLMNLINGGSVRITKFDISNKNPTSVSLVPSMFGINGNNIRLDFGAQGLGGNRTSNLGDGYYRVEVNVDGDSTFESSAYFHRLLGDITGDGQVDNSDKSQLLRRSGPLAENDVNGDGLLNLSDTSLLTRAFGRKLWWWFNT